MCNKTKLFTYCVYLRFSSISSLGVECRFFSSSSPCVRSGFFFFISSPAERRRFLFYGIFTFVPHICCKWCGFDRGLNILNKFTNLFFNVFIIDAKIFSIFDFVFFFWGYFKFGFYCILWVAIAIFRINGRGRTPFCCFYSSSCCCVINGTVCSQMYQKQNSQIAFTVCRV